MHTFSTKSRLKDLQKHLASFPNVAMCTASNIMACSRAHPLRVLLGVQDLPPVGAE